MIDEQQPGTNLFTATGLSRLLELDRKTVQRRLIAAGLEPEGERSGNPTYRLKNAATYLAPPRPTLPDGTYDPAKLPPRELDAWECAQHTRVKREQLEGGLIPASDVEQEFAEYTRIIITFLETLPDRLERDSDLTPLQRDAVETFINHLRESMHTRLTAESLSDGAANS